ncbi:hypothetical protein [Aquaticitalea lipolytica]|uniref:hypothetical protein n=1 Tax=Aquaticitalea lipolytica TaxID=1247562 RepID=UPI001665E528|nr:hypothetical protein [Aquaticitalea lipolytica]
MKHLSKNENTSELSKLKTNSRAELENENKPGSRAKMLRNLIFVFTLGISLISCKNVKTKSYCEFDFFENSSGIKFPENVEILDCEDDLEGLIWLHLKFDRESALEFVTKNEMHKYSNKIKNELSKLYGSEDDQLIESVSTYINENVEPITKNQDTYLKTVQTEHQFVIYIINKDSGYFWGQIGYPDWSGD